MLLPVVFLVHFFLLSWAMIMSHSGHIRVCTKPSCCTSAMRALVLSSDASCSHSWYLCTLQPAGWAQQLRDSLRTIMRCRASVLLPMEELGRLQGDLAGCLEKPLLSVGQDMLQ